MNANNLKWLPGCKTTGKKILTPVERAQLFRLLEGDRATTLVETAIKNLGEQGDTLGVEYYTEVLRHLRCQ